MSSGSGRVADEDVTPIPASDYQLLLPEGWFRIPLDPGQRERSVEALVERQFKGTDDLPHVRNQLRQELLGRATEAFDEGGIELYISLQQAGPLTIPASLLVGLSLSPSAGALPSLDDLAARLSEDVSDEGADGKHTRRDRQEISLVEIAAGRALRVRSQTEAPPEETGSPSGPDQEGDAYALESVTLDYQLPVPGAEAYLLLAFSTPLVPIADAMVDLFDAIAGSLTWKGVA
ncbi:hypothetical protein [Streptomyces sp. NPDC059009]|uniref:hypothetical protein n=1 Tax=Streptomyces sp. NPDC059009 TaxID=3346694 RepID=UPI0036895DC6